MPFLLVPLSADIVERQYPQKVFPLSRKGVADLKKVALFLWVSKIAIARLKVASSTMAGI
ncbi:MAG: hypothetical protein FWC80_00130 [Firmicutes bacterium]|nr:hypothetical protein [Bacillota bacterium]